MDNQLELKLEKLLNTRNFFNYKKFYDNVAKDQKIKKVVEVGSWKGHSIIYLAKKFLEFKKKDFEIYAVDIWEKAEWPNADEEFRQFELKYIYEIYNINMKRAGVRHLVKDIKDFSHLAANQFPENYLDFVYLDGDHREEGIQKDVLAWKNKLKKGGILGGHDYYTKGNNAVKKVVDEFSKTGFLPPLKFFEGNVWYCQL